MQIMHKNAEHNIMPAELQEKVLIGGDLRNLSSGERLSYLKNLCESLGLNPLTRPFEYINLSGKLTLYARKDATEQLRKIHNVSIMNVDTKSVGDAYVVTVAAQLPSGRSDSDIGVVPIGNLKGDNLANALMKAITKAKRRVTLSICGLGMLDESELETIPNKTYDHEAQVKHVEQPKQLNHEETQIDLEKEADNFINRINEAQDMEELKAVLIEANASACKSEKHLKEKLAKAKDNKKAELENVTDNEPPAAPYKSNGAYRGNQSYASV